MTRHDGHKVPQATVLRLLQDDGHTLADTLAAFYGFDLIVHAWDIAQADGREVAFGDEELTFIEASIPAWGGSAYMEGICKPAREAAPEADQQTRILAALGKAGRTS